MIFKGKKLEELSKSEIITNIIQYCDEQIKQKIKDNLNDEDFNSASWGLKQAHNTGYIRMCQKLINSLPK